MKVKITKQMAKKILAINQFISDNCDRSWGCSNCPLNSSPVCRVFTGELYNFGRPIKPEDLVGEYEIMEDKKDENNK